MKKRGFPKGGKYPPLKHIEDPALRARRRGWFRMPLSEMQLPQLINVLLEDVESIFHRHDKINDNLALKAIDRLTKLVEIAGVMDGLLGKTTTTVNVLVGSEQAMRTLGAANELQLAEELEARAKALRARWAEKALLPPPAALPPPEAEYTLVVPVVSAAPKPTVSAAPNGEGTPAPYEFDEF